MAIKTIEDLLKFISKIEKENDCWIWSTGLNTRGYGKMKINNKSYQAHRLSYQLFNGKIPPHKVICHVCDNPPCVNPKHLWMGTQYDNIQDMTFKRRVCHGIDRQGENNPRSKLKNKDIDTIFELLNQGISPKEIAKKFNVHWSTIYKAIQKEKCKNAASDQSLDSQQLNYLLSLPEDLQAKICAYNKVNKIDELTVEQYEKVVSMLKNRPK